MHISVRCGLRALATIIVSFFIPVLTYSETASTPEWSEYQGNSSHTGGVSIDINLSTLQKAWEWNFANHQPSDNSIGDRLNVPVTTNGKLIVTENDRGGHSYIWALDESNGNVIWQKEVNPGFQYSGISPPATDAETIYFGMRHSSDGALVAIDATNGTDKFVTNYSTEWGYYYAPTINNETVYLIGRDSNRVVVAIDKNTGETRFTTEIEFGQWHTTPLATSEYLYVLNYYGLVALDGTSGNKVFDVPGPTMEYSDSFDLLSVPFQGPSGEIIGYARRGHSGFSRTVDNNDAGNMLSRPLTNFDSDSQSIKWVTDYEYVTVPALINDYIYVASNNPLSLDKVRLSDGKVLQSWRPNAGLFSRFTRNIVATENYVFFSTDNGTFAIKPHLYDSPIKIYSESGSIAISPANKIYITTDQIDSEGRTLSDGRIVALAFDTYPDGDGDSIPDNRDNCVSTPNPEQKDSDGDRKGDACDTDIDGDGVDNGTDNCPELSNPGQYDLDGDGIGSACDSDLDGDGVENKDDNCPWEPNSDQLDSDMDSQGNACDSNDDNDAVFDEGDNCPLIKNDDQSDIDGDRVGDACDDDDDGDGVADDSDNCPVDVNPEQSDLDGDGMGDTCDPDDDNDQVNDEADNCPIDANPEQSDLDGDGMGEPCDSDDDNDQVNDETDNCPVDANPEQTDLDGDDLGDPCDPDDDNDQVNDETDNCPVDYNPDQSDRDEDGEGDVCDETPDDINIDYKVKVGKTKVKIDEGFSL